MNNLRVRTIVLGVIIFMGISSVFMIPLSKGSSIFALKEEEKKNTQVNQIENKMNKLTLANVKDQYVVIKKGNSKKIKLNIVPSNTTNKKIQWSSNNSRVALVSNNGVIQGKGVGSAKIIAKAQDGSNKKVAFIIDVIPKNSRVYKDGFFFHSITKALKNRMSGKSYKENKFIGYSDLRYIRVKHYNYAGKIKTGELVVNKKIAQDTIKIFYELYKKKYPIQKMVLIDQYDGDDIASMEANNTSAFNYRVIGGSISLSKHAYGMAIDINPRINPYVSKGGRYVSPSNGKVYAVRNIKKCKGKYRKSMIKKGDFLYRLFVKYGFKWGGDWKSIKDYQHFEKR